MNISQKILKAACVMCAFPAKVANGFSALCLRIKNSFRKANNSPKTLDDPKKSASDKNTVFLKIGNSPGARVDFS